MEIDLGKNYNIERIELVTHQDASSTEKTRSNFVIEGATHDGFLFEENTPNFDENPPLHNQVTPLNQHETLTLNFPGTYRAIRVRKTVQNERLLIAELRIFVNNPD